MTSHLRCTAIILYALFFSTVPVFAQEQISEGEFSEEILSAGEDLTQEQIWSMIPLDSGKMGYPVRGGGKIISKFGDPRPGGRSHAGVDIEGPRGRDIVAAWPGVVVYSHWDRLGGWAVKIKHSNGLSTYYAHMNRKSDLRPGQTISQGTFVGPIGNSGDAKYTVTHLHFGVYNGRSAVNPKRYLP